MHSPKIMGSVSTKGIGAITSKHDPRFCLLPPRFDSEQLNFSRLLIHQFHNTIHMNTHHFITYFSFFLR